MLSDQDSQVTNMPHFRVLVALVGLRDSMAIIDDHYFARAQGLHRYTAMSISNMIALLAFVLCIVTFAKSSFAASHGRAEWPDGE